MNDTDVFNSIVKQLRHESPELPKEESLPHRGPLGLYVALCALSFILIIVSLVANYPLAGLPCFLILVACSNAIVFKVQPRLQRK